VAAERNRRKRRGPNTPEGKQRSRGNATKHGVLSQTPVLPLVEDEEEWRRLRQDTIDFFQLEGEFAVALGERVAALLWRLRRAGRMETEEVRHYQADVPEDWASSMRLDGLPIPDKKTREQVDEMRRMMMARLLPGEETMEKILRYETRLHRYLMQTIYMIMVLKGWIKPRVGKFQGLAELNPPSQSKRIGTRQESGSDGSD
jgi:hypothetical protein